MDGVENILKYSYFVKAVVIIFLLGKDIGKNKVVYLVVKIILFQERIIRNLSLILAFRL